MEELGNSAHSIPFLAVFPGDKPKRPHVLADWFTKDDLLRILAEVPDPPTGKGHSVTHLTERSTEFQVENTR